MHASRVYHFSKPTSIFVAIENSWSQIYTTIRTALGEIVFFSIYLLVRFKKWCIKIKKCKDPELKKIKWINIRQLALEIRAGNSSKKINEQSSMDWNVKSWNEHAWRQVKNSLQVENWRRKTKFNRSANNIYPIKFDGVLNDIRKKKKMLGGTENLLRTEFVRN